jgi:hypothetical protein
VGRSPRIIVRRKPERGIYDRSLIDAILDEALICHVGFVVEGQPYVIPTIHARANDTLLVHGSQAVACCDGYRAVSPCVLRSRFSTTWCWLGRSSTTP